MGLTPDDFVRQDDPIEIPEHDEPEPDVALLRGEPGQTPRPEDLRLLIEVSRTTYEKDRGRSFFVQVTRIGRNVRVALTEPSEDGKRQ